MDPETKRAWRRLHREVREDIPIVLGGLASTAWRVPRKLYLAAVRGWRSLSGRVKERDFTVGDRRALVAQLSRVRLRSPIYKA
jgi:hypothetical protein